MAKIVCVSFVLLALLATSSHSFSLLPSPLLRPSADPFASTRCRTGGPRAAVVALRAQAGDQDVPEGFKAFEASEKSLDEWFETLKDSRSSIRSMASMKIAELHDKDGKGDEVIARLMKLLVLEDVHERRAAVQALGMMGVKVLPPLIDELLATDDRLVRASCSKAIGAVALKNPELLPDFPQSALDGMKKAILDIPDPVTKIATVSSLGQIGGGDTAHGYPGCERALDVLCEALAVTDDMGLAAAAVNAVATIGQSNEAFRPKAVEALSGLKERAGDIDGFMFVEQMISNHIENLSGGGLVGEMNKGRAGADTGAMGSLAAQFAKAESSGKLGNAAAAPPAPDDDWIKDI